MQPGCPANAVHSPIFCSAKNTCVMSGDNAVRLPGQMQFTSSIPGPRKTEFRDLLKSTQLLNRKELEDVFYIQIERLDDSYPLVYQLHRSDERIKRIYAKTPAVQKRAAPPFSKLLQNRVEYGKVFNIWINLLL